MADDDKRAARAMNKRYRFANEPMGNKTVKKIPGCGPVNGQNLNDDGYTQAKQVYGQFLVAKGDKGHFDKFLMKYVFNAGDRRAAFEAMKSYDRRYNH
ncbi:barrier-to-autointegration factor 1-like [Stylophora pistillata]|uniref:barrier-to-autointegration factor 1-like n=1 Tax=Stylophora pistillata TaxID=50429 RepID=UPI000C038DC3|nr:barrier-to-autointegration factor 1-like [Stylophora pistillata]